jgi:DNA-binding transcriptional regulator GbsR (MarR family)
LTLKEMAGLLGCSVTKVSQTMKRLNINYDKVLYCKGTKRIELKPTQAQKIINEIRGLSCDSK